MPIVDIHAHAFADKIVEKAVAQLEVHYGIPVSGAGTTADLIRQAEAAGVDLAVIHTSATTAHQVQPANNWVAAATAVAPGLMGFGTLHPEFPDVEAEICRLVGLGLRGLKLHPDFQAFYADSPAAAPIFRSAEAHDLVVMCHCGDPRLDFASPERLARVARRFPDLRLVVAHMGGAFQWQEARRHIVPLLSDHPNLYTDTSSSLWLMERPEALRQLELFGPQRVLFGTDYPIRRLGEELQLIQGLLSEVGWGDAAAAGVLGGNSCRLLGIPV